MVEVTKQIKVQLVHGYTNVEGVETKEVTFRRAKAGDLKVMDGKGDHEGMIEFAARITGLVPSIIAGFDLEDYGLVIRQVRSFLDVLTPKT